MSERKIILGIDTSNYTTSAALIYTDGELIANLKYPLPVKEGARGLSQSEAVFSHTKNIPHLMRDVGELLCGREVAAIGVSTRPRNLEGSYMPCFLSGVAVAESISATCHAPVYTFSHQCGHLMAAIYSSGADELLDGRRFPAFHVSGGTTEMLSVFATDSGFTTKILGGTADLNAGQLIDRVGVFMGLKFPAGPEMERLAAEYKGKIPSKKPCVNGYEINISGIENSATKLYTETKDKSLVAAYVLDYVGKSLSKLCENYEAENGKSVFLFGGGVMSNSIIKNMIASRFKAYFAEPKLSADNAVGIAVLAMKQYNKK